MRAGEVPVPRRRFAEFNAFGAGISYSLQEMARLCDQCGYDVTGAEVRPGGRLCPECGSVGRGVRPWRGFRRALLRSVWVGVSLWGASLALILNGRYFGGPGPVGLRTGSEASVFDSVLAMLVGAALLVSIVEPLRVAGRLGRTLTLAQRGVIQAKLAIASTAVHAVSAVVVFVMMIAGR